MKQCDAAKPYIEIGYSGQYKGGGDYIFGCLINDVNGIPEGLTVVDTGLTDFVEIEFAAGSAKKLVGGEDGPGAGMGAAMELIKNQWLPEHRDEVELIDENNMMFAFHQDGIQYITGMIEVYKTDIQTDPKMSFYIPRKN